MITTGNKIGPYEVQELLGQGGMAQVYRALHVGLNHYHALKVLPLPMTADKILVTRFLAEAQKMARLQHPNIATVHTVSESDAVQPYFAMELIEGGDLSGLIAARGRFTLEEALPILRQIAAALDYAHGSGLIHRDVKPANILLQQSQQGYLLKMVDFGIAHAQEETDGQRLTRTGMIVGTPQYMSPEQSGSGAPVDHRSDLYSLGIIAYEMLCGRPPFQGGEGVSMISIVLSQVRDAPTPPSDLVPGVPPSANAAILRALEKDPSHRFSSCGQFVEALAHYIPAPGPVTVPVPNETAITTVKRPKFPLKEALLSGLAVLALSAGIGLIAYVSSTPSNTAQVSQPLSVEFVSMPDLMGKSEEQARGLLTDHSLVPDVNTGFSSAFGRQTVMEQSPAAGEQVPRGSTVSVRISLGARETKPVATPAAAPPPLAVAPRAQWLVYTHPGRGWRISYPPDWTYEEKYYESDNRYRVTFKSPFSHVSALLDTAPEIETPPLKSWQEMDRRFVKAYKGRYRKLSITQADFTGYEGARWEYLLQRKNEPKLRHINRGTHVAGHGYALLFSAPAPEFLRWEPVFSQMYLSFGFPMP